MKVDLVAAALRLGVALFLFTLTVAGLCLIGAAQSFYEETLLELFRTLKALSWLGLLVSWLGLLPWSYRRGNRVVAALLIGLGFAALFAFVLVWGTWVYPEEGGFPW